MWIGVQWRLHELKPLVVHVYCPLGQSSVLFLSSEKTSESTISSSPPDDEKQIDLVLRMSSRVCTNFIPDHFGITITPVFPSLKTSLLECSYSSNILPLAFLPPPPPLLERIIFIRTCRTRARPIPSSKVLPRKGIAQIIPGHGPS